ncbi:hypothetical protein [Paenibacillus sp. 7541]|uniref:hypothetical protein n=1 Tax=Paenibacillus sp. 7541 TaxID=2026236 RepID=UPI000BA55C39|nr:hypothetical protein [Paenibacillus sp. 7541]PAK47418.1 hypothetical protein CHH75_24175 [Paenibacillus sp. 7541]
MSNLTKVSGFKLLFICASLGLILLGSGCATKTEIVSVPAEEMITIPWNAGWSPAISITPGIPFELRGSDEIAYELSGDTDYLCVEVKGRLESISNTGTSRKAGERVYWSPLCGVPSADLADIEMSWITVVRKQEGYPTGLVLVGISSERENGKQGSTYKADIIASLAFPQQEGDYQDISDEDLKELEAEYKNNPIE